MHTDRESLEVFFIFHCSNKLFTSSASSLSTMPHSNCIIFILLFITKNHTVHRFNVCTRNIIQIENHEYIYQIIVVVGDSVPITYFHKSNPIKSQSK